MMVEDVFSTSGLFVPEQLPADARLFCFQQLAGLGITVDEIVERMIG
jgi:hypothetical protein